MMKRNYICDVPGCCNARSRWQRICGSCWPQLPGHIRRGITDNHRLATRAIAGSTIAKEARAAHRQACRDAREHLDRAHAANTHHVSPQEAFARTERLLGEH